MLQASVEVSRRLHSPRGCLASVGCSWLSGVFQALSESAGRLQSRFFLNKVSLNGGQLLNYLDNRKISTHESEPGRDTAVTVSILFTIQLDCTNVHHAYVLRNSEGKCHRHHEPTSSRLRGESTVIKSN